MSALTLIRYIAFGVALAFSVIVLGLGAHFTYLTITYLGEYYVFAAMGLASGGLGLILLPTLIIFGACSKNSFPTMVAFELAALGVLWVLWIAAGALAATAYQGVFGGACGYIGEITEMACKETSAITAFSFLTWLALMGYWIVLLVFASIGSVRGYPSFTSSVMTTNFLAPRAGATSEKHGVPQSTYAPSTVAPQFTGQTNGSYPSQAPPQQGYNGQPQQPYGQPQPGYGQPQYANGAHPGVPQV